MQSFNSSEKNSIPQIKRETISQLAHRHLRDQNHTTTDEELRNAVFVLSENGQGNEESLFEVDNTTVVPPLPFEQNNSENDREIDKNKSSLPNPYNVLG